jgi:pyruvate/2-oxoglutarate dehydrogenase complex dihydrolipoamide dehydrogenase (E3) component
MPQLLTPDLCVVGAGPGGIAAASAAAALGASVVLVERERIGGQSLIAGAVASKALLAAAKRVHDIKNAWNFGVKAGELAVNHRAIAEYVQQAAHAAATSYSEERLSGLGIDVVKANARFKDAGTVEAGDHDIQAKRFIVAAGSAPLIPPIPGLDRVPYFNAESVFSHPHRIPHLIVIGGDSRAIELAQAYRRLGSDVTILAGGPALPKDDPELRAILMKHLREEGVRLLENARVERLEPFGNNIQAVFATLGKSFAVEGSHLLLSMGRAPAVSGLGLEAAGIPYSERGIAVSGSLRTANKKVYAIGDVTGEWELQHAAEHHAAVAVKNALLRLPVRAERAAMPWATYSDPELAHVGLTEEIARERHGRLTILRWPYSENARAQAGRETAGFVKVIASRRGRILGAGIVGAEAGEIIQMWSLAMQKGLTLRNMSGIISPVPTLAGINKSVAESYFLTMAQSPLLRRLLGALAKFG